MVLNPGLAQLVSLPTVVWFDTHSVVPVVVVARAAAWREAWCADRAAPMPDGDTCTLGSRGAWCTAADATGADARPAAPPAASQARAIAALIPVFTLCAFMAHPSLNVVFDGRAKVDLARYI
jgi:hypothetical protein